MYKQNWEFKWSLKFQVIIKLYENSRYQIYIIQELHIVQKWNANVLLKLVSFSTTYKSGMRGEPKHQVINAVFID